MKRSILGLLLPLANTALRRDTACSITGQKSRNQGAKHVPSSRCFIACPLIAIAAVAIMNQIARPVLTDAKRHLFEIRTYTTEPGKLPDLLKRFRDHTTKLFEKHGMTNIGYWVPTDEPRSKNTLIYVLAHDSRDAAKSWDDFKRPRLDQSSRRLGSQRQDRHESRIDLRRTD